MKSFKPTSAKANFGSKNPPLLNIETDHYVTDELHMLLRVMDAFMQNLINDAVSNDQFAEITGGARDRLAGRGKRFSDVYPTDCFFAYMKIRRIVL